jgi:hypothetical protein
MRMLRRLGLLSLATGLMVAACDDDDPVEPTVERYTAALTGANESPPVQTNATGNATFTVNGNNVNYTVTITNWPANTNVSGAHIHSAPVPPATTTNPLVHFPTSGTGAIGPTGGTGTLTQVPDAQLTAIRAGGTYFNVHATTTAGGACPNHCPGGLIRGNVVRQ